MDDELIRNRRAVIAAFKKITVEEMEHERLVVLVMDKLPHAYLTREGIDTEAKARTIIDLCHAHFEVYEFSLIQEIRYIDDLLTEQSKRAETAEARVAELEAELAKSEAERFDLTFNAQSDRKAFEAMLEKSKKKG
jgi:hypothetical protein